MTETKTRGTDVSDMKRTYRTVNTGVFPDTLELRMEKEYDLRYGENPNQPGAVYRLSGQSIAEATNVRPAKSGKGGLSATNLMDVTRALELLKFFGDPAVAVMKHLVPSGFARQHNGNSLDTIYVKARDADARSAFGSVVVFNRPVDQASAEAITSTYVEVVAAPEFEEGAMAALEKKKDLRTVLFSNIDKMPKFVGDDTGGLYDLKALPTGRVIVQKPYLTSIRSVADLVLDPLVYTKDKEGNVTGSYVVERDPTPEEVGDMLMAWYVNFGVRSNGIVFGKDGVTVAVGSGQQERVGAVEQAILKGWQKELARAGYDIPLDAVPQHRDFLLAEGKITNPFKGAVMSSDAFLPYEDSVERAGSVGASAVIQPGGSVKDHEVIQAVNRYKMAMVYTLERCFGHF